MSAALMLVYMIGVPIVIIYALVLATRLVGAQLRAAKALETLAARPPDTRIL
ncbi:hypothetical protein [Lysobacter sp. A03]|uniref:hypothetical protein n=1 Tax=Lysobacter sp. A03 TaxID=1199154 RepID=UPI001364E007|nr:hypothetical protein [Lysobacter sp. A03]